MTLIESSLRNICVLNFNELFEQQISVDIINDLHRYNILNKPLSNKDVKKIIYHNIILQVCETSLKAVTGKPVFIFTSEMKVNEFTETFGLKETLNFLNIFLKKLENMLPIKIVILNKKINHTLLLDVCYQKVKDKSVGSFTFEKIKTFVKRYDLTFLTSDYLNRVKTKQLMIY